MYKERDSSTTRHKITTTGWNVKNQSFVTLIRINKKKYIQGGTSWERTHKQQFTKQRRKPSLHGKCFVHRNWLVKEKKMTEHLLIAIICWQFIFSRRELTISQTYNSPVKTFKGRRLKRRRTPPPQISTI